MRRLFVTLSRRPEIRYLFFGGLNTAFSYGLFTGALLLLHWWGVPGDYAIAITFSWFVSNLTSFLLQRRFVFNGTGNVAVEFFKFTSVTFASFAGNLGLSTLSVYVLGFDSAGEKLVSQLVVTIILVIVTYALHRSFSFRKRPTVEPAGTGAVLEDALSDPGATSGRGDS